MRLKIIAAASSAERRFSSWIGGSILASLVSYPYVCGKYFKTVCGCDHVSDSVHVTVFVAICLCVVGVVQLCMSNLLYKQTVTAVHGYVCSVTSDALHTVWFLAMCM